MAGTAVKIAVLMIVVASVCLDVCKACGECETPSIPVYHPPKAPVYYPPKAPKAPKAPPKSPKAPPKAPVYYPPKAPVYYPPRAPPTIPAPPPPGTCPVALVQLGVCSPLLGGIVGGIVGSSHSCCALLNLLGVDVELCLCLALDANILGLISVNGKIDAVVSILTTCGYKVPPNLSCPN